MEKSAHTDTDIFPYLAGLIDGEGALLLNICQKVSGYKDEPFKYKYLIFVPEVRIELSMNDENQALFEELCRKVGGKSYNSTKRPAKRDFRRKVSVATVWHTSNHKTTREVLTNITSHLRLKRKQGRLLLRALEILDSGNKRTMKDIEELADIKEQLTELNVQTNSVKWTKDKIIETAVKLGYT